MSRYLFIYFVIFCSDLGDNILKTAGHFCIQTTNEAFYLFKVDPLVILAYKFHLKCLFRRIARLAQANAYWLIEEGQEYEGVDNVKLRVAQAMRKTKKKTLLTLADKALLNKPAEDRTEHEKKYIYRIIGGLKCFKRYPNHVKKKLAAVTYFKYYGPGRTIIRQHDMGQAMYFIVTGEVVVTHLVYDGLLKVDVPVEIGRMHAGDLFGEVSLLHNIPRSATCKTTSHCELLTLMKDDFKRILQSTIQASWDVVNTAMSLFSYFDGLDEVSRREGCIVAKMKSYNVDDIIFGDQAGVANFVYFVLEGCCQMIENMDVLETTRLGRTYYILHDPLGEQIYEQDDNLDDRYFPHLGRESTDTMSLSQVESTTSSAFKSLNSLYGFEELSKMKSLFEVASKRSREISSFYKEDDSKTTVVKDLSNQEVQKLPAMPTTSAIKAPGQERRRESVRFSLSETASPESKRTTLPIRTYFMQVCRFNAGSTFGFGENMRDRRIVALTPVSCMLMPKLWLLQNNTANIWTRIRHYLDKKMPTKQQLFKVFEIERRWGEYRDQLVKDVVSRCNTVNATSVHDVPYSIRMEEMIDV